MGHPEGFDYRTIGNHIRLLSTIQDQVQVVRDFRRGERQLSEIYAGVTQLCVLTMALIEGLDSSKDLHLIPKWKRCRRVRCFYRGKDKSMRDHAESRLYELMARNRLHSAIAICGREENNIRLFSDHVTVKTDQTTPQI